MFYLSIQKATFAIKILDPALAAIETIFKSRFPNFYSATNSRITHDIDVSFNTFEHSPLAPTDIEKIFSWQRDRPLWGQGDAPIYLTDGASVVISDATHNRIDFFMHPDTLAANYFLARTFLLIPILDVLRFYDLHYLHAALVTKKSTGLLLLGHGGAGKSTLSATLVEQGWAWISDDNLLLDGASGECIAFEQSISLHPDLALAMNLHGTMEKGKVRIPHASLGNLLTKIGQPTHMILLEKELHEPWSKSQLLQQLLIENPLSWISKERMSSHLQAYQNLIRRADLSRLTFEWSRAEDIVQTLRLD